MPGVKTFYEDFTSYLVRDRVIPNPRHLAIQSLAEPIVRSSRRGSALDGGCGIGIMSQFLRRYFERVVALDISEKNIGFARQTVLNVEFVVSDLLGFQSDERFDLIALFDVLEHISKDDLPSVIEKVASLSHDEGSVLITIPSAAFARANVAQKQVIDEDLEVITLAEVFVSERFELRECRSYGVDFDDQYRFLWFSRRPVSWRPTAIREPRSRRTIRLARAPLNMLQYRKALAPYGNVFRRRSR
jgi:SAM-dependent methyltransferase